MRRKKLISTKDGSFILAMRRILIKILIIAQQPSIPNPAAQQKQQLTPNLPIRLGQMLLYLMIGQSNFRLNIRQVSTSNLMVINRLADYIRKRALVGTESILA